MYCEDRSTQDPKKRKVSEYSLTESSGSGDEQGHDEDPDLLDDLLQETREPMPVQMPAMEILELPVFMSRRWQGHWDYPRTK